MLRQPAAPRTQLATPLAAAAALALIALAPVATAVQAAPPAPRGLDIYWIDVEGGAATLVVTPAGEAVLIDTGWPGARDADRIAETAAAAGVTRIDHLVTTHWHTDHFGGIEALASRLPVGRFYDHGFPPGDHDDIPPALKEAYLRVTRGTSRVLRAGDALALREAGGAPALSARVLTANGTVLGEARDAPQTRACPERPGERALPDDTSDNYRSVGLVFQYGAFRFLDLGDLTWNVEHKLVCPANLVGTVDVYQVTHHGLEISNHPALLQAMGAQVAVVDNGPRKGGKAEVYRRLVAAPGPPDVFQLHRNLETGPGDNAPPARVANAEEACTGRGLHVRVDRDGRHFRVDVAGRDSGRVYEARGGAAQRATKGASNDNWSDQPAGPVPLPAKAQAGSAGEPPRPNGAQARRLARKLPKSWPREGA